MKKHKKRKNRKNSTKIQIISWLITIIIVLIVIIVIWLCYLNSPNKIAEEQYIEQLKQTPSQKYLKEENKHYVNPEINNIQTREKTEMDVTEIYDDVIDLVFYVELTDPDTGEVINELDDWENWDTETYTNTQDTDELNTAYIEFSDEQLEIIEELNDITNSQEYRDNLHSNDNEDYTNDEVILGVVEKYNKYNYVIADDSTMADIGYCTEIEPYEHRVFINSNSLNTTNPAMYCVAYVDEVFIQHESGMWILDTENDKIKSFVEDADANGYKGKLQCVQFIFGKYNGRTVCVLSKCLVIEE